MELRQLLNSQTELKIQTGKLMHLNNNTDRKTIYVKLALPGYHLSSHICHIIKNIVCVIIGFAKSVQHV